MSKEDDLMRLAREQVEENREQAKALVRALGHRVAKPEAGTTEEDRAAQILGRSLLIKALME